MQHSPMTCPAPQRASREAFGLWTSHPWTVEEVKAYRAIDGYFVKGWHDFADRAAAIAAGVAPEKEETPKVSYAGVRLSKAIDKLTPEEKLMLLEKLA